eukprot:gene4838-4994_t
MPPPAKGRLKKTRLRGYPDGEVFNVGDVEDTGGVAYNICVVVPPTATHKTCPARCIPRPQYDPPNTWYPNLTDESTQQEHNRLKERSQDEQEEALRNITAERHRQAKPRSKPRGPPRVCPPSTPRMLLGLVPAGDRRVPPPTSPPDGQQAITVSTFYSRLDASEGSKGKLNRPASRCRRLSEHSTATAVPAANRQRVVLPVVRRERLRERGCKPEVADCRRT